MDPFQYLESLGQFHIKPGLTRIGRVMESLDSPHLSMPSVMVGGTNGKGSTCHMIDAVMSSFPVKRALYTSPHLISVTERLKLDGMDVDRELLGSHLAKLMQASDSCLGGSDHLTYFELITAASFDLAASAGADMFISEVGMGGRWDATNILEPQVSAVTSISLDHTEVLGEDVIAIAGEKAGIIKPSTPVVIGPMQGCRHERTRCLKALLDACTRNGSPVVMVCDGGEADSMVALLEETAIPDWRVLEVLARTSLKGATASIRSLGPEGGEGPERRFTLIDNVLQGEFATPFFGTHQAYNAAIALSASLLCLPAAMAHSRFRQGEDVPLERIIEGCVEELEDHYDCSSLRSKMSVGLSRSTIPGRMELRSIDGRTLIIDGGHNGEAGRSIANSFRDLFPGKKASLLMAMMREKDPVDFSHGFSGSIGEMVLTQPPYGRGMPPAKLLEGVVKGIGGSFPIHIREDLTSAYRTWFETVREGEVGIACGSFYLYKHFREAFDPH